MNACVRYQPCRPNPFPNSECERVQEEIRQSLKQDKEAAIERVVRSSSQQTSDSVPPMCMHQCVQTDESTQCVDHDENCQCAKSNVLLKESGL